MQYQKCEKQYPNKSRISVGQVFNRLTVIDSPASYFSETGKIYTMCLCKCLCGKEKIVAVRSLIRGDTESCGCLRSDFAKRERKTKSTQIQNNRKRCCSCLKEKTGKDFFKDNHNKDKLTVSCKECHYLRLVKRKYNLSRDEFYLLLEKNNYSCQICDMKLSISNKSSHPCVDHCHKTGKVRGILCKDCNLALHNVLSSNSLLSMIKYLTKGKFIFNKTNQNNHIDISIKKKYALKYLYGCTIDNFHEMIGYNNGKCHICDNKFKSQRDMCVDHCHKTNEIRGVLCNSCNSSLSKFKENIATITSAIKYLQEHSSPSR